MQLHSNSTLSTSLPITSHLTLKSATMDNTSPAQAGDTSKHDEAPPVKTTNQENSSANDQQSTTTSAPASEDPKQKQKQADDDADDESDFDELDGMSSPLPSPIIPTVHVLTRKQRYWTISPNPNPQPNPANPRPKNLSSHHHPPPQTPTHQTTMPS